MEDDENPSFWRTQGALGLIVAVFGLAGVVIPLVLTRDDGGSEPEPSPTTAVVTRTATSTATPAEPRLLGRGRFDAAASSTLAPDDAGNRYDAALVKDGDTRTAWSEGVAGPGVGESLEFSFDSPVALAAVELVNGYAKTQRLYRRNGRLSQVRVVTDQGSRRSALDDARTDFQSVAVRQGPTEFARIVIDGVFGGERYEDTLVSEVRFRAMPGR
ncbi:MAG TPA: hypothetical protein VHJ39_11130 [Solirubrobacteraceae bacterium]|jgi:hypothetical protein|nr:hypothetical protein [Solirubrobacteraceae bacterium]